MKQKKILMIAYYFPPFGGVPVQRTLKFVKYLLPKGWKPVVLTVRNGYDHFHPNDPTLLEKIPTSVKVARTGEINIFAKIIKYIRTKAPARLNGGGNDSKLHIRILKLRKLLYNSLWFPDEKNCWIPGAIFKGLGLLVKGDIQVIYVSGYPWSAFLVGTFLSMLMRIPLILDFRDAWTLNPRGFWDSRILKFWESLVLYQAGKVVFSTNIMREGYIDKYPWIDKEKFITITNGYDYDDFKRFEGKSKKDNKKFLITFTGTFNDNIPPLDIDQTPYYFLQGLSKLLKEKDIYEYIKVRFVGNFGKNNEALIRTMGLEDVVELTRHVSHDDCIMYQTEADLLLLIIYPCEWSKLVLTGKLFEYIGARKPILALVPDGEAKDLIVKEKLGITIGPKDVEGIKDAIFRLYSDWRQDELKLKVDESVFKKYEMKTLTKKLVEAIEGITNKNS